MPTTLTCPHCGWTGDSPAGQGRAFRYLEEVTSLRWVVDLEAGGLLRVEASEHAEEGGLSPRLLCGECLGEFPLPAGIEVEFVA